MGAHVPLKNYFGEELAVRLANSIKPYYPSFPVDSFVHTVAEQTEPLELKARVRLIAGELHRTLPLDYPDQMGILLNILGPENEREQGMFTEGYFLMPIAYFVEQYGLNHFRISMDALYEITKRHTSEYAIRPYLLHHSAECLETLSTWAFDPNSHVRRLVSEGTRPRLPWAKRIEVLNGDPLQNLALLEPLLDDRSDYVRKSVANHLNDLTKDYKQITIHWMANKLSDGWEHGSSVVRHALRSLIKSGDPDALAMLNEL
ncbi:DNA alkylation repair protein [Paenibacillus sp. RC67]|uniref:DNA alkylation repair protein n=1 Tax=Paenibacillus sp. RC67 TaxID=3039392 RepID=UPI0024AD1078|nr:DNA alkylation repair protein [Paenibacillus sp. RC67]